MAFKINLTGQTFNRWKANRFSHTTVQGKSYWYCTCACGTERKVAGADLIAGHSKSCGCIQSPPKGFVFKEEPRREYVPVNEGVIECLLAKEPDYFERDTHMSLFDTFIRMEGEFEKEYYRTMCMWKGS